MGLKVLLSEALNQTIFVYRNKLINDDKVNDWHLTKEKKVYFTVNNLLKGQSITW